ncbi:hypothetical protein HPB51_011054 [Rhipicephalus microplus]|uniref:Uncharacterized protein n=1 Tax=Rhipicephalus microplus TaxID=6941 RepID=A0A9J6ETD7_RHIMP|nr:hypothetical protein HPB51_011054 [Rhipicephalus microplus]
MAPARGQLKAAICCRPTPGRLAANFGSASLTTGEARLPATSSSLIEPEMRGLRTTEAAFVGLAAYQEQEQAITFRRGKHGPSLATKLLKKPKLRRARKRQPIKQPSMNPGDVLVTETLATYTTAQVVWQDGSVENGIPSADLYPIHHLDGHEFFPGDFVVENTDTPPAHEYAVVKKVDHSGRTAVVTKFKTYMAGADPHPEELGVEEVSVYDIKDHPDFKYRPASCVIRVANFEDKESESTAGQVVDVHPAGKVEVQWVSGKTSLCYPQELYRIGEYDSDDLWDDGDEEGDDESCSGDESWETQSEKSLVGDL